MEVMGQAHWELNSDIWCRFCGSYEQPIYPESFMVCSPCFLKMALRAPIRVKAA